MRDRQALFINSTARGGAGDFNSSPRSTRTPNLDRHLDRMLRYMPDLNSKIDENFESYILGFQAIVYGVDWTVVQKLDAVWSDLIN